MGFFDAIANVLVESTNTVYGYTATWGEYTAEVKYKDLEGEAKLGDVKYGLDKWLIEYRDTDFPGLKTAINKHKKEPITVTVRGVELEFFGVVATALSDGLCVEVKMRLKAPVVNGNSLD